jgi:hypothetical protein
MDVKGLSIGDLLPSTIDFLNTLSHVLSRGFPEIMDTIFVVNAPTTFTIMWGMMSHLLQQRTKDKLKVIGSKPAAIKAALCAMVDEDCLPVEYGGTCDCGGAGCWWNAPEEVGAPESAEPWALGPEP